MRFTQAGANSSTCNQDNTQATTYYTVNGSGVQAIQRDWIQPQ